MEDLGLFGANYPRKQSNYQITLIDQNKQLLTDNDW